MMSNLKIRNYDVETETHFTIISFLPTKFSDEIFRLRLRIDLKALLPSFFDQKKKYFFLESFKHSSNIETSHEAHCRTK